MPPILQIQDGGPHGCKHCRFEFFKNGGKVEGSQGVTLGSTGLWVGIQLDPYLPYPRVSSDGQKLQRLTRAKRSPRGGVRGIETCHGPQGEGIRPIETCEVPKESILKGLSPGVYPVKIEPRTFEYWPCSELGKNTASSASGARTPGPIVHPTTPARSPRRALPLDTSFAPIEQITTEQCPFEKSPFTYNGEFLNKSWAAFAK